MLTHHRRPVCLSLISTDLPILSTWETAGTIYPKDRQSFHVLLHQPEKTGVDGQALPQVHSSLLTWLEVTPYRVIMTQQAHNHLSYRHFWEKGIYGVSRYWLNENEGEPHPEIRLSNFTRNIKLVGDPLPAYLRVEYELWTGKMPLGHYVLHLDIHH